MSRFPEQKPEPEKPKYTGTVINGVFECDCGEISTAAIHNRRDQKLYWTCPEGHDCSIYFKL